MVFKKFKFISLLFIIFSMILGFKNIPSVLAVSPSSISIDMSPANPVPNQNVTITLSSFAANLDSVNIEWFVDGKKSSSGIGKKSFFVTAKAVNIETRVEARIYLPDGQIDKILTIRPAVMSLLWQANDSYVPPFYKGKALPSVGSEIKVVAMPEITVGGKMVNPNNMTYDWKLDYSNKPSSSGYAKNYFTFINDYLEDSNTVSVVTNTTDRKYSSEASIKLITINPEISFYKKDVKMGVLWENALSNNHIIQGEEVVVAEPYFISPKDWRRPELVYYWSVNDRSVNIPSYLKNYIPLKATGGASGRSKLQLKIENTDKIFQTASKIINIQF